MMSPMETSIDTWSPTTIKPISHSNFIVGSAVDLSPGQINYSTDSLTTYFTLMSYIVGTNLKRDAPRKSSHNTHPSGYGNTSKCYGALGCLNITEDWFGLARPVNLLPLDREIINTQFILRTRDSYGVSSSRHTIDEEISSREARETIFPISDCGYER